MPSLSDRQGNRVYIQFDPHRISATALIADITSKHQVADLFVENPPIEEVIARIYEGQSL